MRKYIYNKPFQSLFITRARLLTPSHWAPPTAAYGAWAVVLVLPRSRRTTGEIMLLLVDAQDSWLLCVCFALRFGLGGTLGLVDAFLHIDYLRKIYFF